MIGLHDEYKPSNKDQFQFSYRLSTRCFKLETTDMYDPGRFKESGYDRI